MKPMNPQRRSVEQEYHRHVIKRGLFWRLHWENLPWLKPMLSGLVKCLGLWERGFNNVMNIRLKEHTIELVSLPDAFDGMRIAWVSDLHPEPFEGMIDTIQRLLEPVSYDICILGGDYCFDHYVTDRAREDITRLTRSLVKYSPVYAILGNLVF